MLLECGIYRLDVDTERTKAYYATLDGVGCDCSGCRNYEKAISALAVPVQSFLHQFGIDPRNPIEMSILYSPDANKTFYDGFFHICGSILEGKDLLIQTGAKTYKLNPDYLIDLDADSSAYFTDMCGLVDDVFPRPVMQLHISFALPWVLEEANPYHYTA